jgi:hypothetical protein
MLVGKANRAGCFHDSANRQRFQNACVTGRAVWRIGTDNSQHHKPNNLETHGLIMGMLGKTATKGGKYAEKKIRERDRNAAASATDRDIAAGWPGWGSRRRRARCRLSLVLFLSTYFPAAFPLPFCADHLRAIAKLEQAFLRGGLFALAMPRASGKTTVVSRAVLWALLYGHRRFACLVGATDAAARSLLATIKSELLFNERLAKDFPDVTYPFRRLQGNARLCTGQTWNGEQTLTAWAADRVVFPTIPKSKVSGATLSVAGLTGALRGQMNTLADGTVIRPEVVVLDDPQTRDSAESKLQTQARLSIIQGDVLGMAGPGQTISAVCPCTVIAKDDLADQLLNRDKNPGWQGERCKMLYSMPSNLKLWDEYRRLRDDSLRNDGDGRQATDFYRERQVEMDEGAQVAWPERCNVDELSAIQHAMNLLFRNEAAFMAEMQNDPKPPAIAGEQTLSADEIARKVNGRAAGDVPSTCQHVTAFVDCHDSLLFYAVSAWEEDLSGYCLDYGAYPDQQRHYFTLADARPTLQDVHPGGGKEGAIFAGLETLVTRLLARQWQRDDGTYIQIGRLLIDSGYLPDIVGNVLRRTGQTAIAIPSKGIGVTAGNKPFSEYEKHPGDQIGHYWRTPAPRSPRELRAVHFDSNYWKTLFHGRLSVAMGGRGCYSLYGTDRTNHQLLADHLSAEYRVQTEGRGRTVWEWKVKPGHPDNHLLDCAVGTTVAASMLGCSLPGMASGAATTQAAPLKLSDLAKQRRGY